MNSSSTSQSFLGRRSNSTNSLAQFYHDASNPIGGNVGGELDFCNAFWGTGDAGYEVLMARLRASGRTVEELKTFWKERAAIEEDYGKRLTKLARTSLGKDEIGDLKQCLDSLRTETEKQAAARVKLALDIKRDVEAPTGEFAGRLANLKKTYQANTEKTFKHKSSLEASVSKARERYEQDCLRINAYTANSSIVQGKELDKLQKQMEKVQATVGNNEKDFRLQVRALEEMSVKWESEWKGFCDHVQDLEEERMEFIKDNVWLYANAVSSICVTDDESCERVRVTLEGFESANDIEAFVKSYGTGSVIPDPPPYVDYSKGEMYSERPGRTAKFTRQTTRASAHLPNHGARYEAPVEPELPMPPPPAEQSRSAPPQSVDMVAQPVPPPNANLQTQSPEQMQAALPGQPPSATFGGVAMPGMTARSATAQPVVDHAASPAPQPAATQPTSSIPTFFPRPPSAFNRPTSAADTRSPAPTGPAAFRQQNGEMNNEEDDPVARSLAELRRDPPPAGSIRRGTSTRRQESTHPASRNSIQGIPTAPKSPAPQARSMEQQQPTSNRMSYQGQMGGGRNSIDATLVPPTAGHTAADLARSRAEHDQRASRGYNPGQPTDFNAAAQGVVGAHPGARPITPVGSAAPRTPSPAFMQAPTQAPSHVDEILGQYHQAFPGERTSRGPSRAGSISSRHSRAHSVGAPAQVVPKSPAREGFVGIGSGNAARAPSPYSGDAIQRAHTPGGSYVRSQQGHGQQPPPQQQQPPQPQAAQQPAYQSSTMPSRYTAYSPSPQTAPLSLNNRSSMQYGSMPSSAGAQVHSPVQYSTSPQPTYVPYAGTPAVGYDQYGRPFSQPFGMPPQGYNPMAPPAGVPQPAQTPAQQYAATVVSPSQPNGHHRPVSTGPAMYQSPTTTTTAQQGHPYARAPSPAPAAAQASYYPAPAQQQQPVPQNAYARAASPNLAVNHQQQQQQQQPNRSPSPVPPVAPVDAPPTGQYSTTGQPILFFKALYDYEAQSEAEFDFQVGDIIAVTHTPADGWWSGELLDEARRQPGRTDFPSNFVCLF